MHAEVLRNEGSPGEQKRVASPRVDPENSRGVMGEAEGELKSDLFALRDGVASQSVSRAKYLLPEAIRNGDGVGPVVALEEYSSKLLVVTLGITDVVERMGLTVSVWGSADHNEWGPKPLLTFRQRQYCGVYSVLLNLAMYPEVRALRVQWNMNRWGKGERVPLFGFEVFLEESGARVSSSAVI